MTTFTQSQGARSTTILNMGTLASATYAAGSPIDLGASIPLDVTLEVVCKPNGTPTGNKQLMVFAQLSLDNSNFTTGPTSGTTTTDENQLHWIGNLPVTTSGQDHRKMFSLSGLPIARYVKPVVKNDMGVALTSGDIFRADITGAA